MSHLVDTFDDDGTIVNLDKVTVITDLGRIKDHRAGYHSFRIEFERSGTSLIINQREDFFDRFMGANIPAPAGWQLVTSWLEDGCGYTTEPIIAFRDTSGEHLYPVTAGRGFCDLHYPRDGEGWTAVMSPDGRVDTLWADAWENIDAFMDAVREMAAKQAEAKQAEKK